MPDQREPTPWELLRRLDQVLEQLARMENRMLTVDVFNAYRESMDRQVSDIKKDQQEWTVESRGEHVRLDAKIDQNNISIRAHLDTYKEKQEQLERSQRDSRTRNWVMVGVSVLGFLLSIGAGLILQASGGAP